MAHRLHRTATYLLVALGLVHAGLAPVFYDELTPNTVWFVGAGLALVFLGLLNAAATLADVGRVWAMCRVANVVALAFGALAVVAVQESQAYLGLVLLAALAATSFVLPRSGALSVPYGRRG